MITDYQRGFNAWNNGNELNNAETVEWRNGWYAARLKSYRAYQSRYNHQNGHEDFTMLVGMWTKGREGNS